MYSQRLSASKPQNQALSAMTNRQEKNIVSETSNKKEVTTFVSSKLKTLFCMVLKLKTFLHHLLFVLDSSFKMLCLHHTKHIFFSSHCWKEPTQNICHKRQCFMNVGDERHENKNIVSFIYETAHC